MEHGLPELAQQLSEACGPGMPGPYRELKKIGAATGRNPSGAAAPPPFDKGGRGSGEVKTPPYDLNPVNVQCKRKKIIACCPDNRNPPSDSVY